MTSDLLIPNRVQKCRKVLTDYSDDDTYTNLVDFLADAMHLCRRNGQDFQHLLTIAENHYQTERIEETGVFP
jgi:hypothetical protein